MGGDGPLAGKLLVATPMLAADPNFHRTVVLVIEHSADGAAGVVVNRPSDMRLAEALPAWSGAAAEPAVVFFGGPVQREGVVCLGRAAPEPPAVGWRPVGGGIGTVDLNEEVSAVLGGVAQLRVFAGYAGWSAGQVESELRERAWFVVEADVADVFSAEPAGLWRGVLARQRGKTAWFARYPDDPLSN